MNRSQAIAVQRKMKIGHGGTLDPMATGVLVVGLNGGCKMLEGFLKGCKKGYRATGVFGVHYDTYDTTGVLVHERPFEHVTEEKVRQLLVEKFTGDVMQRPPAFSALRVNGKRAYDISRKRQKTLLASDPAEEKDMQPELELPMRPINISRIELTQFALPEFEIDMECGSGTYVRSVIHDIGTMLDSAAAMSALVRTMQGAFRLEDCISVEQLEDIDRFEKALRTDKDLLK
ncbi:Pseudouridine synthase PUS4 [Paramicrosporidium saccamoebae]|uniref:tRNA pseudouridine(55) synthase n=1 Tax=Paramicrosporidium saccamoebae TaxID=1246581 RepID=A0A2H9TII3_9FUNG|nr:Pseudouridine synthase PUS4 [Paramicrosporidium saccamoebae]